MNVNRYFILNVGIFILFNIGCSSNEGDLSPNNESAQTSSDSEENMNSILNTTWNLTRAADQEGTDFQPLDASTNYFVRFNDDGSYEHNIFCQLRRGSFDLNNSVLEISEAQITEAADCPFGPVEDGQLIGFIINFYRERQLIVSLSANNLTLMGINNDFLRYQNN